MKPLALDLCAGLGGWAHGLLAEGWDVIGYDIEDHRYGDDHYPSKLVIQDILTLDGKQFRGKVSLVVASPPCTEFSYMAMPWTRGKQIEAALLGKGEFPKGYQGSKTIAELTALFDACVRIGCEAECPTIIENVRGAQKWVGKAKWFFGSFGLWGDVPALMPITQARRMKSKISCSPRNFGDRIASTPEEAHALHYKLPGNNSPRRWEDREVKRLCDAPVEGFKTQGMNWSDRSIKGQDFTRIAGRQAEGIKDKDADGYERDHPQAFGWKVPRTTSKCSARKAASAAIAKIPLPLARWIAKVYNPTSKLENNHGHHP